MRARRGRAFRWWVYILRCRDGTLYTGATVDLERRLARHAAGQGARYTRSRLPVTLVHAEPAEDRSAALRREAAVKRCTRAEKLALATRGARRPPRGAPAASRTGSFTAAQRPGRRRST